MKAKKDLKHALLAAGKMYLAAQNVINANAKNISKRIELLDDICNIYNNEIIKLENEKRTL